MTIFRNRLLLALAAVAALGCNGDEETPPDEAPVPQTASATTAESDAAAATAASAAPAEVSLSEVVTVYKSPTCGCCSAWVDHMREAGFQVETRDVENVASIKAEHGVAPHHQSCHTALVGDYVLEGHVPADLVRRMLEEDPEIAGLAVPGMPRGSPGMEMPDGTKDAYDVIAFSGDGSQSVYASR